MDDLLDNRGYKQPERPYGYGGKVLPNASSTLVLGIISLATMCMYGVPGLVCGIIALSLHRKDKMIYLSDPQGYAQSYKNAHAGYVCAIIGVCLSGLFVLALVAAGFVKALHL